MTAHLESMKPGKEMRLEQAKFILEEMQKSGPCIFAGDTNLRDSEWESFKTDDIQDAWISVGSTEANRVTWHYENSKSRFDRAWARRLKIQKFETFGKEIISMINERPSDHLGLRVEFDIDK